MDVTKSNFNELLPEIEKAIDDADFISIDGEFTGLNNGPDVTAYDTPAQYYEKLRTNKLDFLLIQVGLCAFRYDKKKKRFSNRSYNFYVFPRMGAGVNFLCQSSSINFLTDNGFDFNKLFKEGISYLTLEEEQSLRDGLEEKYKNLKSASETPKIEIPERFSACVESACAKVKAFLESDEEIAVISDRHTRFILKLIYQTAYERFPTNNFSLYSKLIDKKSILMAEKGKSRQEQEDERFLKENDDITDAVGFAKVIKHISKANKLVVGHNMLLDICHIVKRFCAPLPKDYQEFKNLISHLFPKIIDTKHMCSTFPFRDIIPSSVLDHLLKTIEDNPFTFPTVDEEKPGEGYVYGDSAKSHEAGYDAFVTGLAFISLSTYLGKRSKPHEYPVLPGSSLLKPFMNRIFLMKLIDYPYINIKAPEPEPSRDHVFYITFPKEWKTTDIMKLFESFGPVHVSYCDQTSAWVTLLDKDNFNMVITELIESKENVAPGLKNVHTVVTWYTYMGKEKKSDSKETVENEKTVTVLSTPKKRKRATDSSTSIEETVGNTPIEKDPQRLTQVQKRATNGQTPIKEPKENAVKESDKEDSNSEEPEEKEVFVVPEWE